MSSMGWQNRSISSLKRKRVALLGPIDGKEYLDQNAGGTAPEAGTVTLDGQNTHTMSGRISPVGWVFFIKVNVQSPASPYMTSSL